MILSLDEVKGYLKVDHDEEEELITGFILTAQGFVSELIRGDAEALVEHMTITKIAVLYATAYLFEHREDADYQKLKLSLRAMLSGVREVQF